MLSGMEACAVFSDLIGTCIHRFSNEVKMLACSTLRDHDDCLLLLQCRVEANPANRQQFRVTVAAAQPQLSSALHRHLVLLLRTS